MRPCARRCRGSLLLMALVIGGGAVAQELQLDPKALDTGGAVSSGQTKRGKGKKSGDAAAPPVQGSASGKPAGAPNRQFGELEGWSPGKAPPKPKEQESAPSGAKAPVTVSPSGNMGTGFAF
jgi:hypothetical protein